MARKPKEAVDYFPHPVNNGSRMFVMEQTYGDKGYVAYYKLLEMIGKEPGHALDFKENKKLLFYASQIRTDKETALKILETLSEVEAIDTHLWRKSKIVWSQEFVDKISHLYDKRKQSIPIKPGEVDKSSVNDSSTVIYATETPQTILYNSKLNNTPHTEGTRESEPLIEIFFKDLPNSSDFESICRNQNLKKDYLLSMIPLFRANGSEPSYPNFQRFTSHFGHWVRKYRADAKISSKQQTTVYSGSFYKK